MRALLLSGTALILASGLTACMTPRERTAALTEKCEVGAGYAEIAPPANAQAYIAAIEPQLSHLLRRRWPFETHWFRNAAEHKTILCSVAPAFVPNHYGHCAINQFGAAYSETPSGPVKIWDIYSICVD